MWAQPCSFPWPIDWNRCSKVSVFSIVIKRSCVFPIALLLPNLREEYTWASLVAPGGGWELPRRASSTKPRPDQLSPRWPVDTWAGPEKICWAAQSRSANLQIPEKLQRVAVLSHEIWGWLVAQQEYFPHHSSHKTWFKSLDSFPLSWGLYIPI